jgi:hypothetical protein
MKQETRLQTAVSDYIKMQYPDVIFTSESSGLRVPMGLAVQMKRQRSRDKLPDLIILHPSGSYHGMCLELKSHYSDVYLKNGSLRSMPRVQEQNKTLIKLRKIGYFAEFCVGFDQAMHMIDAYMNN